MVRGSFVILLISFFKRSEFNVINMSHDYGESEDSWFKLDFGGKEERTW